MFSLLERQNILVMVLAAIFMFALLPLLYPAEAATLVWHDTVFEEEVNPDGTSEGAIDNPIMVELHPEGEDIDFVISDDYVGDGLATVANLPEGLTCHIEFMNERNCMITLEGQAVNHGEGNSIDNLTVNFLSGSFTGSPAGMHDHMMSNLEIRFTGITVSDLLLVISSSLTWDVTEFTEADADDGSIGNAITVGLFSSLDRFEQSDDMVADGMAEVNNLPPGLTCVVATTDESHCTITLEGQANHHDVTDSIDNLSVEFLDGAFTGGDASAVEGAVQNDLVITFIEGEPAPATDIVATFVVGETSYFVNGVQNHMDVAPFAESNRAFVPVRFLAYCMGMTEDNVEWDGGNQTATITEGDVTVILQIGNMSMNVNGDPQLMDVAPQARDSRIFLPARFVVEAFGGTVAWDGDTQTVTVMRDL